MKVGLLIILISAASISIALIPFEIKKDKEAINENCKDIKYLLANILKGGECFLFEYHSRYKTEIESSLGARKDNGKISHVFSSEFLKNKSNSRITELPSNNYCYKNDTFEIINIDCTAYYNGMSYGIASNIIIKPRKDSCVNSGSFPLSVSVPHYSKIESHDLDIVERDFVVVKSYLSCHPDVVLKKRIDLITTVSESTIPSVGRMKCFVRLRNK